MKSFKSNKQIKVLFVGFVLMILLPFTTKAKIVEFKHVEKVALNAFMLNSGIAKSNLKIKEVIPVVNNSEIVYYIFNFETQGHIVVTNENALEPILGYGITSNIDFDNIPPGLLYLLNNFKKEISYAREQKLQASTKINNKWNYYLNLNESEAIKNYSPGTFLLETTWGQADGYNIYCPISAEGLPTVVGCGGVAFGQILKYWNCRVSPQGIKSY